MSHWIAAPLMLWVLAGQATGAPSAGPVRPLAGPAQPGAMAPNLFSGPRGVLLTWLEPGPEKSQRLRMARLDGNAWGHPVTIFESPRIVANWADVPSVVETEQGTLVAYWAEHNGPEPHSYDAVLGRSEDGGRTWIRLGPAHHDGTLTEHGFVSLLVDRLNILVAWLDGRQKSGVGHHQSEGPTTLRVAELAPGPVPTRLPSRVVDGRVCDCCGTSAAITSRGPVIVYRDRAAAEVRDISVLRRISGAWTKGRSIHQDGWKVPGCPVNGPTIAAHGNHLAVAWYTYAASEPKIRVAFSDDAGEHFIAPADVDIARGTRVPIGRVDVVLLSPTEAAVSWMVAERERGDILVRRVARDGCLGKPLLVTVSRSDREAGSPRMESAGSDLVLAWTEIEGSESLRTARFAAASLPPVDDKVEPARATPPPTREAPAMAPPTALMTLDGRPTSLKEVRGKVTLLNFWATWCEPCRMELPELADLQKQYGPRGLEVVGVNVDKQVSAQAIGAFASRRKATFTQWLDGREALAAAMGVTVLPATFLLDREGRIVWRASGAITAGNAGLRGQLDRTLAATR